MSKFGSIKIALLFGFLFILSIMPFVGVFPNDKVIRNPKIELFNPNLSRLNTMDKVISYTDSIYLANNTGKFDTLGYVKVVTRFTKERFHHGLSHYNMSDNWIAYLLGKFLWSHMSAIVNPEDVLKHSEGLCSQQTIVFMDVLMRKGIKVRSVGLGYEEGPGHFLSEVQADGSWHLYDVSLEPNWKKISFRHKSMNYYLSHKDSLFVTYEKNIEKDVFDKLLTNIKYGDVNSFPAKKMLMFHKISFMLTYIFPVLFFLLFCLSLFKNKIASKLKSNSIVVEEPIEKREILKATS